MAVIRDMIPAFELFQPTSVDDAIDRADSWIEPLDESDRERDSG